MFFLCVWIVLLNLEIVFYVCLKVELKWIYFSFRQHIIKNFCNTLKCSAWVRNCFGSIKLLLSEVIMENVNVLKVQGQNYYN